MGKGGIPEIKLLNVGTRLHDIRKLKSDCCKTFTRGKNPLLCGLLASSSNLTDQEYSSTSLPSIVSPPSRSRAQSYAFDNYAAFSGERLSCRSEMRIFSPVAVLSILLSFFASGSFSIENFRQAFPIIEPDPGHTKLRLSREGLEAIERITNPIAAVAVIGPYRSGKSFLLNQLLSLSCYEGFGVGHMRDTKTKGIWVWGAPVELDIDGVKTSVFYLDTEGFESIGKSNVYDDRIFALATVMSSVLIYNLPETIREADISRLSFAVELAEEFYGRFGQDVAFEPAKLLWLIQRDFLQGKSVQEMVDEALRRVPNTNGDKNIDQVNQIRDSLAIMGDNSTAFSLPQPHLLRTKLCDLKDDELDSIYVKKRDQLKTVVSSIIRPKIVQGKSLNGKEFVSFLEQILEALNKGEIPSTGSLVEVFNKGILERCLKLYSSRMSNLGLPTSEESLQRAHEGSSKAAMEAFDEQHFGRHHAKKSAEQLVEEVEKVYKNFVLANELQSSKLCEALYIRCEEKMDQLQVLRLPSMAKFNAGFLQCDQSFERECVGPSKSNYEMRMMKMLGKSKSLFIKEYNHRLFNWLVAFSLVMVVVGRFIIKFILIEIGAWILFIFLETYTRMFWTSESLYYNPVWHGIVRTWEAVVYSPVLDLDRWAIPLGAIATILVLYWRCYGRRKRSRWALPLYNNQKDQRRSE
ncbi:Guanylate-binding protein 4 [Sesamum alatum]|uniref:Guanylate-binding protein 4 n=1 Tax=Sesamum alatum TaxID=300844 RepID=A0AAE1XVG2_9LAMI|nr:Guanylate-binding protein 4 [Sesamum alatum]